ncbi:MAG: hypothetical protein AAFR04_15475 [Pseudomonadota bacterium]
MGDFGLTYGEPDRSPDDLDVGAALSKANAAPALDEAEILRATHLPPALLQLTLALQLP